MPLSESVSPFNAPNFDVFSPARRGDDRGVILGTPLDGGQSYVPWIGLSTVREIALAHADRVGLVDADELASAREANAQLAASLVAAQNRVEELEATQERIAGLVKDGWKVQKVMGRPKKTEEN